MIKHLKPKSKEEMMDTDISIDRKLIMLNNYDMLSLAEKIEIFKNLPIDVKQQMLLVEFQITKLTKKDIINFSDALGHRNKLKHFYNKLPLHKQKDIKRLCTPEFINTYFYD